MPYRSATSVPGPPGDRLRAGSLAPLALVALSLLGSTLRAERAERPHLLLVYCDDLGYGDLSCYGNPVIKTPHLDRFAAGGLKLTSCYSGAPNCSPSRAALLTGRTPHRVGLYDIVRSRSRSGGMHLPESEVTVEELLRDAGYETYHAAKWHLGSKTRRTPDRSALAHGFQTTNQESGSATDTVKDFTAWLASREDADRPFFAYLAFHESHEPVPKWSPPEYRDLYRGTEEAARRVRYGGPGVQRRRAKWENRNIYYGCVSQLDAAFGNLVAALDKAGVRQKTFIYFSSDNGPEHRSPNSWGSPGPLRGAKGHLHEGGIRVPGIIQWPGHVKPGSVSDEPVAACDILPTFCALAGAAVPSDRPIDGVSFLPVLEGKKLERRTPLYWSMWGGRGGMQYAMRDGDWKILGANEPLRADRKVMDHVKGARLVRFELYKISEDAAETNDLSREEPEVFARLKKRFLELHREILAEGPRWDLEDYRNKAPGRAGQRSRSLRRKR